MSSAIFRVSRRENPYAQIDRQFLEFDPLLSWKATGLLAYLLAKPDGWQINVTDLINRKTDGKHAVYEAIKELEARGYITRERRTGARGRYGPTIYNVYEQPLENPLNASAFTTSRFSGYGDSLPKSPVDNSTVSRFSVSGFSVSGKPATRDNNTSDNNLREQQQPVRPTENRSTHQHRCDNNVVVVPSQPESTAPIALAAKDDRRGHQDIAGIISKYEQITSLDDLRPATLLSLMNELNVSIEYVDKKLEYLKSKIGSTKTPLAYFIKAIREDWIPAKTRSPEVTPKKKESNCPQCQGDGLFLPVDANAAVWCSCKNAQPCVNRKS